MLTAFKTSVLLQMLVFVGFAVFTAFAYGHFLASFGGIQGFKTWLLRKLGMPVSAKEREELLEAEHAADLERRIARDMRAGKPLGERKR